MKRALGNWVVGDDFWDRKDELVLFMDYVRDGANILLAAPRRIGKTSLIREAARLLEDRFVCLHVDLQKSHSAADAVAEVSVATRPHESLWGRTKDIFAESLGRLADRLESLKVSEVQITLRSGLTSDDWQEKGDTLFQILAESEKPTVLFMDEVPILVNRLLQGSDYRVTAERRKETDAFMSWLRENTIRHRGKVRTVVTGSIGFEPILRLAGLNATLNTFTPFRLSAWSPAVAQAFLIEIAKEYKLDLNDKCATAMIDRLGYCIPHYVQVYFDNVYRICKTRNIAGVTVELVDEVYDSEMLSIQGHAELSHLEERLRTVLGPDRFPLALEILTEAAVVGVLTVESAAIILRSYAFEGKSTEEVLREVLGVLEHDLYLTPNKAGEYVHVSKLVADWWKARFTFGYKAAAARKG